MSKVKNLIRFLKSHGVVAQEFDSGFMVLKVIKKENELIKMWQEIEPTWSASKQFLKEVKSESRC